MRTLCQRFLLCVAAFLLVTLAAVSVAQAAPATPAVRQDIDRAGQNALRETGVAGAPNTEEPQGGLLDPDLGTALFTVLVFVVLLIILGATAWKPILGGLKSREKAIRDSIEAAQLAKEDAERSGRELEAKMADVQRQASLALAQAKADAVKLADTIRAQAEAESAALKDRTLREIDAAKQQALTEINTHAADLGTAVARKILQRDVTVNDQQRLVDESLAELAKKN
ncbi:MAG TPA: F0F1 ATP synthase subunit B [Phycisphaerae bacterium]|nr:F0F1 ATP synthase subunit B [Phycisphaerae bacterium]